ncbi:Uncharacterised protein [Halioglobus japonicus]|nr:Uncharacterised protein [Halioglobus japonicus]
MYYQYFGLTEAPFSIAVNPRYLFMSARHRDALAHLLYGVGAGGGFILLTGEVGTGKTTINRCLLEQLPSDTDVAIILNPALNAIELLASVCDELGIEYDHHHHTLKTLTDNLHSFLLENHARGRKTVLLIDEAQHLDFDVLEQIRLLTNLETNNEKLLQIILIGQPELAQMLARPELRQLNQRITARYNLGPLNLDETSAYIQHRMQVAGMSPERVVFSPAVVRGIYKATRGIPRVINVLCDRMLLGAYGRSTSHVDHDMLQIALREVLGEQAPESTVWRWVAITAVVLLLVWVGGWLLGKYSGKEDVDPLNVAAIQTPSATIPEKARESRAETLAPAARQLPGAATVDVIPVLESSAGAAASIDLQSPSEKVDIADVLLPPGDTLARLWELNSDQPVPPVPCADRVQDGLACVEGEVWTWDELAEIDRPMALEAITPERFSAEVLLLGIEGSSAWVYTETGIGQVSLAELAPYWTGRYRFFWRPPENFTTALTLWDENDVVAAVAQRFAELDKQPKPLAGRGFNRALEQRVRLFQQQHALVEDGAVGVQTLLKLNEQLGVDVTAEQARRQLQQGYSEEVVE